jgi:hypothetical protein
VGFRSIWTGSQAAAIPTIHGSAIISIVIKDSRGREWTQQYAYPAQPLIVQGYSSATLPERARETRFLGR